MKARILSEPGTEGREDFLAAADTIREIAENAGRGDEYVDIILIDRDEMEVLNRNYKKREGAAEVLTFPYREDEFREPDSSLNGEIYLCWGPICEGAESRGVEPGLYLLRLAVHGICHLLGYSHHDQKSAEKMEEEEIKRMSAYADRSNMEKLFS